MTGSQLCASGSTGPMLPCGSLFPGQRAFGIRLKAAQTHRSADRRFTMERHRMGSSGLVFFSFAIPLLFTPRVTADDAPKSPAKPNVLFIAIDDLNHWVHYLGRNEQ